MLAYLLYVGLGVMLPILLFPVKRTLGHAPCELMREAVPAHLRSKGYRSLSGLGVILPLLPVLLFTVILSSTIPICASLVAPVLLAPLLSLLEFRLIFTFVVLLVLSSVALSDSIAYLLTIKERSVIDP